MLATRIRRMVSFDSLVLYVVRGEVLWPEYVTGEDARLFGSLAIPLGEGLSGWVAENDKPIVNGNPSVEPGYLNSPEAFSKLNSALAIPLRGSERVIGVLALYHASRDAYSQEDRRILQAINSNLAVTIEDLLEAEAEKAANWASLPDVRSLFARLQDEVENCARSRSRLGILVCRVEGLAEVRDRLGQAAGDRMQSMLAAELRANCRSSDYVAWAGGDEFALVMPGLTREVAGQRVEELERVADGVSRSQGGEDLLSLVFGDAYSPEDGQTAEELIDAADRRLHGRRQAERRSAENHQLVN
jgi:diguanylate cyclase (GGDEF)-like protein